MDKLPALGELLYIISNYEKGRIKTTGIWGIKYKKSLLESLEIMSKIIELLAGDKDVSHEEMMPIMQFCRKNINIIFSTKTLDITNENSMICLAASKDQCKMSSKSEVIFCMREITNRCFDLIANKEKGYKLQIFYLLMAFHNLPKVYLDVKAETLCNIGVCPISEEEAIKYAKSYIHKCHICVQKR